MRAFHRDGDRDATASRQGYEYGQAGFALGYDRLFGDFSVGASIGKVANSMVADGLTGSGDVDTRMYSLYGGYSHAGYYADGLVSYGNTATTLRAGWWWGRGWPLPPASTTARRSRRA